MTSLDWVKFTLLLIFIFTVVEIAHHEEMKSKTPPPSAE